MKLPMQPIHVTDDGTVRFVSNRIVRWLLDAGPFDMDQIAMLPGITREEHEQFAQLIGYSVSSFGDLSYAQPETVKAADAEAERLLGKEAPDGR